MSKICWGLLFTFYSVYTGSQCSMSVQAPILNFGILWQEYSIKLECNFPMLNFILTGSLPKIGVSGSFCSTPLPVDCTRCPAHFLRASVSASAVRISNIDTAKLASLSCLTSIQCQMPVAFLTLHKWAQFTAYTKSTITLNIRCTMMVLPDQSAN